MKLICVNEEYQHYFIDEEPQPKINKKDIKNYTYFIYTQQGYTQKKRKIFGITIYTYWAKN